MSYAGGWVGKIHQKGLQNALTPSKKKKKGHDPSKCALKNWLAPPPPQKKKKMYVRTKIQNAS